MASNPESLYRLAHVRTICTRWDTRNTAATITTTTIPAIQTSHNQHPPIHKLNRTQTTISQANPQLHSPSSSTPTTPCWQAEWHTQTAKSLPLQRSTTHHPLAVRQRLDSNRNLQRSAEPSGKLALNTNIWLDASSTEPGADNATRPYSGRAIALPVPDPTKGIRNGPSDDRNCSAVLGAECVAAYRKLFVELAGQYAGRGQKEMRSQSWDDACAQLGSSGFHNALPEGCGVQNRQGIRGPVLSARAYPSPRPPLSESSPYSLVKEGKVNVDVALDFKRPNLSNRRAPVPPTPIPILGLGDFYDAAPDNFSAYDRHIRDVVPLVLATFTNSSQEPQQLPWSDTRFVCMSAKDVALGSRVPPPVSSLAVPRVCSMRWLSFSLVVALVVVFEV